MSGRRGNMRRRARRGRAPRAGALLALGFGLALSLGAAPPAAAADPAPAVGATESAALDIRREIEAPNADHAALPRVLSAADAARYARIFALQRDGRMEAADREIEALQDDLLLGHVLFQRFMHPTAWRSSYLELKDWMGAYADHPGAQRIYKLALKRRPANYKWPAEPRSVALPGIERAERDDGETSRARTVKGPDAYAGKSRWERREIRKVQRQIVRWVQRGAVTKSLEYLDTRVHRKLFTPHAFAQSLGVIARGYFRYHKDAEAMAVAARAHDLAGPKAARAHWWGGLAAWRAGAYQVAHGHFAALSESAAASAWRRAAGGYWAARAALVGGLPERVNPALKQAAETAPRSFYGLLAARSLGLNPALDFSLPALRPSDVTLLMRIPAARRAIALIEAGETERADAELRRFVDALPPSMADTLLAFADAAGLADLAYRIGRDIAARDGAWLDAALYPLPGWTPADGFTIDRALVYAFVRQESRFRARAKSHAGARGLMQLMPATAGWIAGERYRGAKRAELFEPAVNLSLGQRYIEMLLAQPDIAGNLFYAAAAYNGGPGNLNKWRNRVDYTGDPLLFIESLPSRETRDYVEQVMANLWVYRLRMGQATPTLDALIAGAWPIYIGLDAPEIAVQPIASAE